MDGTELELLLTEIIKKKEQCLQKSSRSNRFFICSEDHGGASTKYQKFIATFNIRVQAFEPIEPKIRLYELLGLTHLQQVDLAVDKLLLELLEAQ